MKLVILYIFKATFLLKKCYYKSNNVVLMDIIKKKLRNMQYKFNFKNTIYFSHPKTVICERSYSIRILFISFSVIPQFETCISFMLSLRLGQLFIPLKIFSNLFRCSFQSINSALFELKIYRSCKLLRFIFEKSQ